MIKYMDYAQFEGIDCVLYQDSDGIRLLPVDHNDKIVKYTGKRDFIFSYKQRLYDSIFLIDRVEMCLDFSIKLVPKYNLICMRDTKIQGLEIYGGAIDDFFNPVGYFFPKRKNGEVIRDILYNQENVDVWKIKFENDDITIALYYGNVLSNGAGSDMVIHPKLSVRFSHSENNIDYIYRVYSVITRFLQIVRYDLYFGNCVVNLTDTLGNFCGRFYDYDIYNTDYSKQMLENHYKYYKTNIAAILQFSADNQTLYMNHFPQKTSRLSENDFTTENLISIFGAFESEYALLKDIYGKADKSCIKSIKTKLISIFDEHYKCVNSDEEKSFLTIAKSKISNIGNELGQAKKMQKVYERLLPALKSSVADILYLFSNNISDIQSGNISKIATELSEMRGKAAHGHDFRRFSPKQGQAIRFLEILAYAQLLKRAKISDDDIELFLGIIFRCNYKYQSVL